MRRTATLVAMLFAMLWQSVALGREGSTVNALADREHANLHWHAEGHHHHEDGSLHLDDSSESAQHLITDQVSAAAELIATDQPAPPPTGSTSPVGLHEATAPHPFLDGLLRPPRPHA